MIHRQFLQAALLMAGTLLSLPGNLLAEEDAHRHISLPSTADMSIAQVVDAALAQAPEQQLSQVFQQVAVNQKHLSQRWISGVPRINLGYRDDELLDEGGLMEAEAGIEFDLWRWNQQDNAEHLASKQQQKAQDWQRYIRWRKSGEVRELLAQMAADDALVNHAQQNIEQAQRLLETSQKRFRAGDLPENSVLQSEVLLLEARQQLQTALSQQVDGQRLYVSMTGLSQRPASIVEGPASADQIHSDHPRLQYLLAERQQRLTQQQLQQQQARGNTTVSLGIRRERGAYDEREIDSLGVAISVPFGTDRVSRANSADSTIAVAEADVALQQARRELQQQLHEVKHELTLQPQSLGLAKQSAQLTKRQWQRAVKAFELGESDLQPVLLARQQYQQSQLYLHLQELRQHALQSSFKQVVGELP